MYVRKRETLTRNKARDVRVCDDLKHVRTSVRPFLRSNRYFRQGREKKSGLRDRAYSTLVSVGSVARPHITLSASPMRAHVPYCLTLALAIRYTGAAVTRALLVRE